MGLQFKRRDSLDKMFDELAVDPDKNKKDDKEETLKKTGLKSKPQSWTKAKK